MSYAPIESALQNRHLLDHQPSVLSAKNLKPPTRARRRKHPAPKATASAYPIIVHCHLCWDWVWQRPQQFLSRLSQRHRILFVETVGPDPGLAAPLARFQAAQDYPNITLLRLQFPAWRWADGEYVDSERRRLVREFVNGPAAGQFTRPVQWFYDPMAVVAFSGYMDELVTVYDCMDELSQFRGAPPSLREREAELLARADVVFTGGRKLFEAKSRFHPNCHFYGCGVDGEHFGQAREANTRVPPELAKLPGPVLGYFGVIDERMDYALVERLAASHPEWSVVIVGPTIKVDPGSLPRQPNLHWLGPKPYAELPALCKGFDVCLMPFARNEATEYINPTKALEYMATGRMIVSTAVPDVVRNFGRVVRIARSQPEFIALCEQAVETPDTTRIARGLRLARENAWEVIVAQLEQHINEVLPAQVDVGVLA